MTRTHYTYVTEDEGQSNKQTQHKPKHENEGHRNQKTGKFKSTNECDGQVSTHFWPYMKLES